MSLWHAFHSWAEEVIPTIPAWKADISTTSETRKAACYSKEILTGDIKITLAGIIFN